VSESIRGLGRKDNIFSKLKMKNHQKRLHIVLNQMIGASRTFDIVLLILIFGSFLIVIFRLVGKPSRRIRAIVFDSEDITATFYIESILLRIWLSKAQGLFFSFFWYRLIYWPSCLSYLSFFLC